MWVYLQTWQIINLVLYIILSWVDSKELESGQVFSVKTEVHCLIFSQEIWDLIL